MNYPDIINNLIECFKKLPGVGQKTAERMVMSLIKMNEDTLKIFDSSIENIRNIKYCKKCNFFSTDDICTICSDNSRDVSTVCVVDDPKTLMQIEKVGSYRGKYFILNGLISPLDHIGPNSINIDQLISLVITDKIKEIILALRPSLEGETTSLYISKKMEDKNIIVSKIANGIPLGAEIEYIDSMTLELALENRKKI